eukprot:COSAG01_NODE_58544_length_305_cov_1.058252_1_plen_45_part_01
MTLMHGVSHWLYLTRAGRDQAMRLRKLVPVEPVSRMSSVSLSAVD